MSKNPRHIFTLAKMESFYAKNKKAIVIVGAVAAAAVVAKVADDRYAWIDKLKAVWPVTLMCQVLGVSVNGFFEHRQRSGKTPPEGPAPSRVSNEALVAHIRAIHAECERLSGSAVFWL